jgi:hypothetical protein
VTAEISGRANISPIIKADFTKPNNESKAKGEIRLKDGSMEKSWDALERDDTVKFSLDARNVPEIAPAT